MIREDGTIKSDTGYLGVIKSNDGRNMTEFSVGVEIEGKETLIPTLVPGLTKEEIKILQGMPSPKDIPESIIIKARDHAEKQLKAGKPIFFSKEKVSQKSNYERASTMVAGALPDYMEFIRKEEGFRTEAYPDGKNKDGTTRYSIGYGDNSAKKGDTTTLEKAEVKLEKNIAVRVEAMKKVLPDFEEYPAKVKENLLGSWYRGSLSGSPNALKLLKAGKYKEASAEFLDNDEYLDPKTPAGIKKRMKATAAAIRSLGN